MTLLMCCKGIRGESIFAKMALFMPQSPGNSGCKGITGTLDGHGLKLTQELAETLCVDWRDCTF